MSVCGLSAWGVGRGRGTQAGHGCQQETRNDCSHRSHPHRFCSSVNGCSASAWGGHAGSAAPSSCACQVASEAAARPSAANSGSPSRRESSSSRVGTHCSRNGIRSLSRKSACARSSPPVGFASRRARFELAEPGHRLELAAEMVRQLVLFAVATHLEPEVTVEPHVFEKHLGPRPPVEQGHVLAGAQRHRRPSSWTTLEQRDVSALEHGRVEREHRQRRSAPERGLHVSRERRLEPSVGKLPGDLGDRVRERDRQQLVAGGTRAAAGDRIGHDVVSARTPQGTIILHRQDRVEWVREPASPVAGSNAPHATGVQA